MKRRSMLRRLFRRRPKDRWPAWRPDQILTPENRSMTGARIVGNWRPVNE